MERLLPYALPAVVLLSSVGALVMCLLALRYAGPPDSGEDLDDIAHRLFVLRFGHAVAAFCFAGAVALAVVVFSARNVAVAAAPAASVTPEVEQLRSEVRAMETHLRERLDAMESRLAAQSSPGPATATAEKGGAGRADKPAASTAEKPPAASTEQRAATGGDRAGATASEGTSSEKATTVTAPRDLPSAPSRPDSPSKELPARRPQSPSRTAAAGSALPATVAVATPQAFSVHGTRVELATERAAPGQSTSYTVRLFDSGGVPVSGAEVTLQGRLADGAPLVTPLEPTGEPGTYRGRLPSTSQNASDLRLRVARRAGRFELPLGDRVVGW